MLKKIIFIGILICFQFAGFAEDTADISLTDLIVRIFNVDELKDFGIDHPEFKRDIFILKNSVVDKWLIQTENKGVIINSQQKSVLFDVDETRKALIAPYETFFAYSSELYIVIKRLEVIENRLIVEFTSDTTLKEKNKRIKYLSVKMVFDVSDNYLLLEKTIKDD